MTLADRWTFYFLVGIIAFAPVPLASNRPFFWSTNALLITGATLLHLYLTRSRREFDPPLSALAGAASLMGFTILWMLVQILPLGGFFHGNDIWRESSSALDVSVESRISVDPSATALMVIRYISYCLLFFLTMQVCVRANQAKRLLKVCFWIIAAHAAYAIAALLLLGDTLFLAPKWGYQGFATGFFVNRNSFATFLAFGVAIGVVLFLDALGLGRGHHDHERRAGWDGAVAALSAYGPGLAIITTALVLSGSRMGAAAAAAGLTPIFILSLLRSPGRRMFLLIIVAFGVAASAAVLSFSGDRLLDRLGSVETHLDDRMELYRQVLLMISARPLTGYGGGSFAAAFPLYHQLPLSGDVTWDAAHNLYLELITDLGVFGLLPPLAITLLLFRISLEILSTKQSVVLIAGVAVIVVGAVHSLVDFSLQIEANVFLFVVVVAAASAQAFASKRKRAQTNLGASQKVNVAHQRALVGINPAVLPPVVASGNEPYP